MVEVLYRDLPLLDNSEEVPECGVRKAEFFGECLKTLLRDADFDSKATFIDCNILKSKDNGLLEARCP